MQTQPMDNTESRHRLSAREAPRVGGRATREEVLTSAERATTEQIFDAIVEVEAKVVELSMKIAQLEAKLQNEVSAEAAVMVVDLREKIDSLRVTSKNLEDILQKKRAEEIAARADLRTMTDEDIAGAVDAA